MEGIWRDLALERAVGGPLRDWRGVKWGTGKALEGLEGLERMGVWKGPGSWVWKLAGGARSGSRLRAARSRLPKRRPGFGILGSD